MIKWMVVLRQFILLVNSEKRKAVNNMSLINNIKEELKAYEKGE